MNTYLIVMPQTGQFIAMPFKVMADYMTLEPLGQIRIIKNGPPIKGHTSSKDEVIAIAPKDSLVKIVQEL